jgi:hypothetical protein
MRRGTGKASKPSGGEAPAVLEGLGLLGMGFSVAGEDSQVSNFGWPCKLTMEVIMPRVQSSLAVDYRLNAHFAGRMKGADLKIRADLDTKVMLFLKALGSGGIKACIFVNPNLSSGRLPWV